MADTKLSNLATGTSADYFYGIEGLVSKKYNGFKIYNVKDYGAAGNSNITASTGTDDTAAIQSAVDAVSSAAGGCIYFPPGCYKLTSAITFMTDACSYYFLGAGTAAASGGVQGGSQIVGNYAGYLFDRNQINSSGARVRISNLGFRNGSSSGSGIRLIGVVGSKIEHCQLQAGLFGIQLGGVGSPASATFTANSAGTTLTVSGIVGTIDSGTLPCPISGTGVPAGTTIVAFGTGTGGNGTYITNQATTCSGSSVSTNPNAPTSFCTLVEGCTINGLGTYNVNPASSFFGVGVQLSPETRIYGCNINNWGVAVRGYGGGNWIRDCQMESNTIGVKLGKDGADNNFSTVSGIISGGSFEGNVSAIQLWSAKDVAIQGIQITGEVDASHNSTHGVLIDSCDDIKLECIIAGGTYNTAGFYLGGAGGAIRRVRATNCNGSLSKDASVNYSCITAVQCLSFPTLSCTLAQLNTAIGDGDVNAGERRLISDANTALASQAYNAAVTGGGANLASVWYDGSTVRYG